MLWRSWGFGPDKILWSYSLGSYMPIFTKRCPYSVLHQDALAWACNTILMKKAMTETKQNSSKPLNPLELTVWSSVAGLILLTPIMAAETMTQGFILPSADGWIGLVFLAIFSTVVAYVWFADGIIKIGASMSASYVYLVPPFGILGGYLLLDEKLGLSLAFAFVLITGGVFVAQSKTKNDKQSS